LLRFQLCQIVAVFGTVFLALGCRHQDSSSPDNRSQQAVSAEQSGVDGDIIWNCPKVQKIRQAWLKHADEGSARDSYAHGIDCLVQVLSENLTEEQLRSLALSLVTMSNEEVRESGFAEALVQSLVILFVQNGSRNDLVALLSLHCPDRIYLYCDIEDYLTSQGARLDSPVLILKDAYMQCHTRENRTCIAGAFRRGFQGSHILGGTDEEFIRNASNWFLYNKPKLILNRRYGENATAGETSYSNNPLFVLRE